MKRPLILLAASVALVAAAPARAGLNSADWAGILNVVVGAAGAASAGYAASQQAQQEAAAQQAPTPTVFYKDVLLNLDGELVCIYSDGSTLIAANMNVNNCPAYR